MSGVDPPPVQPPASTCPSCGAPPAAGEGRRGRAYRCRDCGSWLFRRLFDDGAVVRRCGFCHAPVGGDGPCALCGCRAQGGGGFWLRWTRRPAAPRVRSVRLADICADEFQPRLSIDLEQFEGLRRSVERLGFLQPLILRRNGRRGPHAVVSGHRRLLVARQLRFDSVPARLLQLDERQAILVRISENLHREAPALLELAEALERAFLSCDGTSRQELGALFGLSDERIDALLALLRAPPELRERLVYGDAEAVRSAEAGPEELGARLERLVQAIAAGDGAERLR